MEKYIKYCKWIGTFALLLIPCIGLAAETAVAETGLIPWNALQKITFTPAASSSALVFLRALFGYVPGVPQFAAAGTTILGPLFAVFNTAILGISGVFLGYTTFKTITEATMDGSVMAKSATIWSTVRVAAGTVLLIPQSSGYSIINAVVMWTVVQSIGLADLTWSNALDYLKKWAPLTTVSQRPLVDYSLISPDIYAGDPDIDNTNKSYNIGSADVLNSLVCSYTIKNALMEKQKRDGSSAPRNIKGFSIYKNIEAKGEPDGSSVYSSYTGGFYQFPYVEGEEAGASGYLKPFSDYGINITTPVTGICGTISYTIPRASVTSDQIYTEKSAVYLPAKEAGFRSMVNILDSVAQRIVNQAKPNEDGVRKLDPDTYIVQGEGDSAIRFSSSQDEVKKYQVDNLQFLRFYVNRDQKGNTTGAAAGINWPMGAAEMADASASYQIATSSARSEKATVKASEDINEIYEKAKEEGWLKAASYFNLMTESYDISIKDYTLYRLTAYATNGTRALTEEEAGPLRSTPPSFSPFFATSGGNIKKLFSEIDGPNNNTSIETLNLATEWIYYSAPYAKLLGKTFSTGFEQKVDLKSYWPLATTNLVKIRAKLYGGAIALSFIGTAAAGIALIVGVPMDFLYYDIDNVMEEWNRYMGGNFPVKDPIVKLKLLGVTLIGGSIAYLNQIKEFFLATSISFIASATVQTLLSFVVGTGSFWGATTGMSTAIQTGLQALTGVNEIARTIIYIYLPIGLAVIGPMFVAGITLSIYIPFVPYILFLFGIMSWFISIIVLMAASPIICFLMLWGAASQENPLLSREAEHFVMQLIAVFFRPTLMVIGLIVSVALARIGVDILNVGFGEIARGLLEEANSNVKMIKQIGIVVIYTFTMVSLVNLCFSVIYLLYNEVMRIAHIQVAGAGIEEKYLGEVKAAGMQFGEAGVGGAKGEAEALKGQGAGIKGRATPEMKTKPPKETTAK